ncbi:MAG: hypothetical protein ABI208_02410 [Ginsengibacter sp.]|jgi:hypothetical protein
MKKIFIPLLFLFWSSIFNKVVAQDTALINYLMNRIAQEQIKSDSFFLPGIFPSYISNKPRFTQKKGDNNMFFNGLILSTIKEEYNELSSNNQVIYDSMVARSIPFFKRFENRTGRSTYNYWRTDSVFVFPYTWWVPILRGFVTLPDDLDDTSYGLMSINAPDSIAKKVHDLMQNYVNSDTKKVKGWSKKYNSIPAYSTWFGKNFPVLFDITVLTNILYFVQSYNLPWTHADSASLQLIIKTIENRDHVTQPIFVSPNYGSTSLILYHLATLMNVKDIEELEKLKPTLLEDAAREYMASDNLLEKIVLSNTFLKWGYLPPELKIPPIKDLEKTIEHNNMPFFLANIFSYFPKIVMKEFVKRNWGIYYPYCPAYNNTLLLEYLLLRNKWLKN